MQRFVFTFIFIVLSLGQGKSYAQDKPDPAQTTTTAVPEKPKIEAKHKTNEKKTHEDNPNEQSTALVVDSKVSGKEVSVLSSADKIAKKANFWSMVQAIFGFGTLVLAGLATFYAKGAWKAGKAGVEVTKDIGQKQVRAYLGFENAEWWVDKTVTLLNVSIKNFGQSPCKVGVMTATMTMRRFIVDLEKGEILENDSITSHPRKTPIGVIEAGGTAKLLTAFTFTDDDEKWIFASGDPDTEVEFDILIEWTDVFNITSKIYFSCHKDGSHDTHQNNSDRHEKLKIFRTVSRGTKKV